MTAAAGGKDANKKTPAKKKALTPAQKKARRAARAEKRKAFFAGLLDMTGVDEFIAAEVKKAAKAKLGGPEKHRQVKAAVITFLDDVVTPFPMKTPRGFAGELATDAIIHALNKGGVIDHLIAKVYDELYPVK